MDSLNGEGINWTSVQKFAAGISTSNDNPQRNA
jgi:hypothetical protein